LGSGTELVAGVIERPDHVLVRDPGGWQLLEAIQPAIGVHDGESVPERVLGESGNTDPCRSGAFGELIGEVNIHTGHTPTIHTLYTLSTERDAIGGSVHTTASPL
jgi:hypothetical protein